jgi:carbamate kinase
MLVVVAMGDDAGRPPSGALDSEVQADNVMEVARHLAALARGHRLVITYGFGSPLGSPSLEQALASNLPGDRLATVPTRIAIDTDESLQTRPIVDLRTFRILVDNGITVLCPGDACIPMMRTAAGGLRTVEAAIDGDLVAAGLATELDADALLLVTSAPARGDPTGATAARVRAARAFIAAGGWLGGVGGLPDAAEMLRAGPGVVAWGQDKSPPVPIPGA